MRCESSWRGVWKALGVVLTAHLLLVAGWWHWHAALPRMPQVAAIQFEMVAQPVVTPPALEPPVAPSEPPPPEVPPQPEPLVPESVQPVAPPVHSPVVPPKPVKPRKVTPVRSSREPVPAQPVPTPTDRTELSRAAVPTQPEPVVAEQYTPPDVQAAYASNPKPVYPPSARRMGYQGSVLLTVTVLASGLVEQVEIRQGSGFDSLDRAAREAVARWRFVPAQRQGRPVAATVTVPIRFQLQVE